MAQVNLDPHAALLGPLDYCALGVGFPVWRPAVCRECYGRGCRVFLCRAHPWSESVPVR
jgi:hypothetical protein